MAKKKKGKSRSSGRTMMQIAASDKSYKLAKKRATVAARKQKQAWKKSLVKARKKIKSKKR